MTHQKNCYIFSSPSSSHRYTVSPSRERFVCGAGECLVVQKSYRTVQMNKSTPSCPSVSVRGPVTSVHLCQESTCAGTLYLGSALYPLSMPHLAGHTSLAFHLSFAYKPECVPGRGSCRWPFSRPNRRRRHLALLLSDSRRSDMWFK